jgi:hypothetical protein
MVAALNIAELASGQLTATDAVVIELIEAEKPPPPSSSDGRSHDCASLR